MFDIVGWSLGNDCPYRCEHCYSYIMRNKGENMSKKDVDNIIIQLKINNTKTVVLGGNEPIFTNGINPKTSLLPHIIQSLYNEQINVVLISSGYSSNYLFENHIQEYNLVSHFITSLDSPYEQEHNNNRKANLFGIALKSLDYAKKMNKDSTILMVAQNWNFSLKHIDSLLNLAKKKNAFVRINRIKATEKKHQYLIPNNQDLGVSFKYLFQNTISHVVTDPSLISFFKNRSMTSGYCGVNTCRINSISKKGEVSLSPCIYLNKYKTGNLIKESLGEIEKNIVKKYTGYNINSCCAEIELNKIKHSFFTDAIFEIYENESLKIFEKYICTWIGSPI